MYGRAAFAGMDLATFTTGATGVLIIGAVLNDQIGIGVSGAGDVNGDGIADIVFGTQNAAPAGRTNAGKVYVLFGSTTMASASIDLLAFAAGPAGYAVLGSAANMNLGITVGRAGDINQDGVDDFLASSERTDQVFLVLGSGSVPTADIDLADAPDVLAFTDNGNLGNSVYGGQDVSGDGVPDLILGSSNLNRAYMMLGPFGPPPPTSQPSSSPSAQPSAVPSLRPSSAPTAVPSTCPSASPTSRPSTQPSAIPSGQPTSKPSSQPSMLPSAVPTAKPSAAPSAQPSTQPSADPSTQPSAVPTAEPSSQPSSAPTAQPSAQPSAVPSPEYTLAPTTPANAGDDSAELTGGAIAGIVIGSFVFLVLLVVLAAFYRTRSSVAEPVPGTAPPTAAPEYQYEMTQLQEA